MPEPLKCNDCKRSLPEEQFRLEINKDLQPGIDRRVLFYLFRAAARGCRPRISAELTQLIGA
jgi:hypothetical protein